MTDDFEPVTPHRSRRRGAWCCISCPPWRGENVSRRHDKVYSSRTRKAGK